LATGLVTARERRVARRKIDFIIMKKI